MSVSGKVIVISAGSFKQELQAAAGRVRDQAATCKVGANAVGNVVRKHFGELNQRPDKEGWKKSNFRAQIRDSVQILTDGDAAVVQINDPRFNLKFHGGTVTPKRGRALAIPLHEEYKGVLPGTFPRSKFFFLPNENGDNAGILAETLGDNRIRAAYLLRSKTTHSADCNRQPFITVIRGCSRSIASNTVSATAGSK